VTLAAWAWIGLAALIAAYVTAFDLWAQSAGRWTMSAQFHWWMQAPVTGPVVVTLWVGISAGFLYHFLINR
jgi:hypothetical protein